jgi:hypothetical protein
MTILAARLRSPKGGGNLIIQQRHDDGKAACSCYPVGRGKYELCCPGSSCTIVDRCP